MPTRIQRSNGFGRSSRFYECDGQRLPSVTTILGAVARPALLNWMAKTERELIVDVATKLWDDIPIGGKMPAEAYQALLLSRIGEQRAGDKLKSKAGDIGSQIHSLVEWDLRTLLGQRVGERPVCCEEAEWGAMAHQDWQKKANMVPRLIEQTVWSNKHGYAGTLDLAAEIDLPGGRGMVVADHKSGKAIYLEATLQVAAYGEALIEMGHANRPLAGLIVRVPKVVGDPDFETRFVSAEEMTEAFKVFLSVLELWRFLEKNGGL